MRAWLKDGLWGLGVYAVLIILNRLRTIIFGIPSGEEGRIFIRWNYYYSALTGLPAFTIYILIGILLFFFGVLIGWIVRKN